MYVHITQKINYYYYYYQINTLLLIPHSNKQTKLKRTALHEANWLPCWYWAWWPPLQLTSPHSLGPVGLALLGQSHFPHLWSLVGLQKERLTPWRLSAPPSQISVASHHLTISPSLRRTPVHLVELAGSKSNAWKGWGRCWWIGHHPHRPPPLHHPPHLSNLWDSLLEYCHYRHHHPLPLHPPCCQHPYLSLGHCGERLLCGCLEPTGDGRWLLWFLLASELEQRLLQSPSLGYQALCA